MLGSASFLPAATLISLDWNITNIQPNTGQYTGPGILGGGTWNNRDFARAAAAGQSETELNLLDSNGDATSVDVTVATFNNAWDAGINRADIHDSFEPLFTDYLYLNGSQSSATITFSGLGAGTEWNLVLYAANADQQGSLFETNDTFNSILASRQTSDAGDIGSTLSENDEYVKFVNLVADINGEIKIDWKLVNTYGALNGFQLQSVPEPSAALLGGLGVLALLRRRR